ncbi:MAG: DUF1653 domain-containing protein [Clostridium sp.]|nr:DUF1653 domain-containing protein [Clostridium sp.]
MERKRPVPGMFYRHFKGNIYQIRELAKDSETEEDMVIYQGMYPPFQVWVRPLSMFLDRVDHEQYPECRQQYRFESVVFQNTSQRDVMQESGVANTTDSVNRQEMDPAAEPVSDRELRKILMNDQGEKLLTGRMTDEEIARRGFLALLDADTYREKRQILVGLREYLNELYLNNLAAALDIVLEEGSSQEHYDTLLHCLETYEKYEGGRLRR